VSSLPASIASIQLQPPNGFSVLVFGFLSLDRIEPFHQHFSLRNYTLQYPFAVQERVPNMLLVALSCLAPAIFIALYTLVIDGLFSQKVNGIKRKYTLKERLWELNCGLLGLALAISMQYVIVGELRPPRAFSNADRAFRKPQERNWQT